MTMLPRVLPSTLLAAVILGGLLAPSPAAAGDDEIAPPPLAVDRSGADQDEFFIPSPTAPDPESGGYTRYFVDDQYLLWGAYHSTEGAASVTITTSPDQGTWTLDYSLEKTATEAEDTFSVDTGECMTTDHDSLRTVTVSITNNADETGRYIRALEVVVRLVEDGGRGNAGDAFSVGGEPRVTRLEEGETTVLELFERDGDGSPDTNSGGSTTSEKKWRVTVVRSDRRDSIWTEGSKRYRVYDKIVSLPRCNMTGYDRGCRTSTASLLAREVWGGPSVWKYRVSLTRPNRKPDWTTYRVPAGEPRDVTLRRHSRTADTRVRVQLYVPRVTYVYNGAPGTHWSREVSRAAWGGC